MSGHGRVADVFGANLRDTNEPARTVVVNREGGGRVAFEIPVDGVAPEIGEEIAWGPHHCWSPRFRIAKLSWERDPDAPLQG